MRIWKRPISVEGLTEVHRGTAPAHIGMEFLEVGDDFIRARVPVDTRTRQPYGLLHGGISVVLAETLGSCGAIYEIGRASCRERAENTVASGPLERYRDHTTRDH